MADKDFQLRIITPERVFYEGTVDMVEFNTTEGQIGVLPGTHSPDGDREAGYPAYYGEGRREGGSTAFRIRRDPSRGSYHSGRDHRMAQ